ncbi:MAG: hypothetical protein ACKPDI_17295 [Actinomycetota bacterium]
MNPRSRALGLLLCVALVGGCSNDEASPETLPPTSLLDTTTSTAAPETTTTVADSTTTAASTSTSTSTTSTIAVVEGLEMSADGLGDALFGAEADGVIEYVNGILGGPTNDTGWQDPIALGAPCPGTEIRFVEWHDLSLMFGDDSPAASGFRHFASYTYGPPLSGQLEPYGLTTSLGIGVGNTVRELRAAYPTVVVNPADEISSPSFFIEEGLSGYLTGATNNDAIISFVGGYGCGE